MESKATVSLLGTARSAWARQMALLLALTARCCPAHACPPECRWHTLSRLQQLHEFQPARGCSRRWELP